MVWFGEQVLAEGDTLSIDGNDGAVYAGELTVVTERPERELAVIGRWRASVEDGSRRASGKAPLRTA